MILNKRVAWGIVGLVLCGAVAVWLAPRLQNDWAARRAYAAEAAEAQAAQQQLQQATDLSQAFKLVAKALRPSVVSINSVTHARPLARRNQDMPDELRQFFGNDMFDRFFQYPGSSPEQEALGSGVIVRQDGYVLTNSHVVRGADEVDVIFSDGRRKRAEIVGVDRETDLAVLKVPGDGLVPAKLGDSGALEVGDWVVAVGSPFGLDQTVTAGIVSAKGRANVGLASYEDFIQTDAAINPGNSGGPLVNLKGEVIGINTAIATRSGGYQGVGFSIPSAMAKEVLDSILKSGRVDRGFIGALVQPLDEDLARSFGFPSTEGALIGSITPDGPSAKGGLREGDIVVEYNGKPVKDSNQFRNSVAATAPNSQVELKVFRDGKYATLKFKIGRRDLDQLAAQSPAGVPNEGNATAELGMSVETLTPNVARQLGFDEDLSGAVITQVEPGGLAHHAQLRPGDVIIGVGSKPIHNTKDLRDAFESVKLTDGVRMLIKSRDGTQHFVYLKSR